MTIAPSCSLLHVPHDAARETGIDPEVRGWLAFCAEKLAELRLLADAADAPAERRDELLAQRAGDDRRARGPRRTRTTRPSASASARSIPPTTTATPRRPARREAAARAGHRCPSCPTTTIGSFPQTDEIRAARRDLREGRIDDAAYERFLEGQIAHVIAVQERLGLDVLVHGEPERNDMVEYFGEQLDGFAFTEHGWVQSYGSRCVKPPILYGDVSRPPPMTVRWWRYAQSLTDRPVKGMLTGP